MASSPGCGDALSVGSGAASPLHVAQFVPRGPSAACSRAPVEAPGAARAEWAIDVLQPARGADPHHDCAGASVGSPSGGTWGPSEASDRSSKAEEQVEQTIERLIHDLSQQFARLRREAAGLRAQNAGLARQLGEEQEEGANSSATSAPGDGHAIEVGELEVARQSTAGPSPTEPEAARPSPRELGPGAGTSSELAAGQHKRAGKLVSHRTSVPSHDTHTPTTGNPHLHEQAARQFEILKAKGATDTGLFPIPHARWIKDQLKIVRNDNFDWVFGVVILSYAVFLGMQLNFRMTTAIQNASSVEQFASWPGWIVGDAVFSTVFLCELVLRVFAYQTRFFTGTPRYWNMFDAFCIIGGVIATVLELAQVPPGFVSTCLRVCRLARLIRTLRVSKWSALHNLRILCYTVVDSLNAFISAVVLLFVDQYIFGLVFMQGVEQYLSSSGDVDAAAAEELVYLFGNLGRTFWTLSAAITGGRDWEESALPLEVVGVFYRVFFGIYVLFTYLCVLNILNGVFVSVAMECAQTRRDVASDLVRRQKNDMIDQMLQWFVDADKDKSQRVSKSELHDLLSDQNIRDYLTACNIDIHSADKVFALLDADGDGEVEPEEFVANLMRLRGEAKSVDLAHLAQVCAKMDRKINKLIRASVPRSRLNTVGSVRSAAEAVAQS